MFWGHVPFSPRKPRPIERQWLHRLYWGKIMGQTGLRSFTQLGPWTRTVSSWYCWSWWQRCKIRYESTFSAGIHPQCWLYFANLIFYKEKNIRAIDKSSPDIIVPDKLMWANNVIRPVKKNQTYIWTSTRCFDWTTLLIRKKPVTSKESLFDKKNWYWLEFFCVFFVGSSTLGFWTNCTKTSLIPPLNILYAGAVLICPSISPLHLLFPRKGNKKELWILWVMVCQSSESECRPVGEGGG